MTFAVGDRVSARLNEDTMGPYIIIGIFLNAKWPFACLADDGCFDVYSASEMKLWE